MKRLIGILLLLCALVFAVSCTREPNKLVSGKPGSSSSNETLAPGGDDSGSKETGDGIVNGGANDETGWGEFHPIH